MRKPKSRLSVHRGSFIRLNVRAAQVSSFRMCVDTVHTAPTLSQWLGFVRTCSDDELYDLIYGFGLHGRMPGGFMGTLDKDDFNFCYRAAVICYGVTGSIQVPREMQLKAVLSDYHGKDTLVSAGTGSGKTLPIALNVLLDDPDKHLITVTLSPLKRLQMTQESDFNTRYGIPTVVINEDTPREDVWWNVTCPSCVSCAYVTSI